MPITYRTDGAWGTGKGANLTATEVDGNFWDVDGRLTYIEDNPVLPVVPIAMGIEGASFTMALSNGDSLGPIAITYPMPEWRGDWTAATPYEEMDFIVAPDGGLGAVMRNHTSAATFDWAAVNGDGDALYQKLLGSTGETTSLGDLLDVSLSTLAAGDFLTYSGSVWQNHTPAYIASVLPAFGGDSGSGGSRGMVPAPAAGDAASGKVLAASGEWVVPEIGSGGGSDSLAGLVDVSIVSPANNNLLQYSSTDGHWHNRTLASLGSGTLTLVETSGGISGGPITGTGMLSLTPVAGHNLLANTGSGPASPGGVGLSAFIDAAIGATRGAVLRRDATGWTMLNPGTAGQYLKTAGTGADLSWDTPAGSGTVTSVATGAGITGGPITGAGTVSLATIADKTLLANVTGAPAAPAATSVTLLLDLALGSTQGQILYRGATAWAALAPGTSGQLLRSNGAAADPSWASGAGSGTVTSVATSGGIVGGPITAAGTVSLATQATNTVLANVSGSTAVPVANSLSGVIDAAMGNVRGSVLYRGAGGWAALGPGTSGRVLTTGGAGADPTWTAKGGGGGSAAITVSDTPPTATDGALWWDSASGQLFVGYDDGSGPVQWVIAVNQSGASLAAGGTITGTLNVVGTAPSPSVIITGGPSYGTAMTFASSPAAGQVDVRYEGPRTWVSGVQATSGSFFWYDATVGQYRVMFDSTGATLNGSGSWGVVSGIEGKQEIEAYTRGLDALSQLRPVTFRYRAGTLFAKAGEPSAVHIGLIAEEVEQHIPEIVGSTTSVVVDPGIELKVLTPTDLIYVLINSVKELTTRLKTLEDMPVHKPHPDPRPGEHAEEPA